MEPLKNLSWAPMEKKIKRLLITLNLKDKINEIG